MNKVFSDLKKYFPEKTLCISQIQSFIQIFLQSLSNDQLSKTNTQQPTPKTTATIDQTFEDYDFAAHPEI
jgi:hypothetical protein